MLDSQFQKAMALTGAEFSGSVEYLANVRALSTARVSRTLGHCVSGLVRSKHEPGCIEM